MQAVKVKSLKENIDWIAGNGRGEQFYSFRLKIKPIRGDQNLLPVNRLKNACFNQRSFG